MLVITFLFYLTQGWNICKVWRDSLEAWAQPLQRSKVLLSLFGRSKCDCFWQLLSTSVSIPGKKKISQINQKISVELKPNSFFIIFRVKVWWENGAKKENKSANMENYWKTKSWVSLAEMCVGECQNNNFWSTFMDKTAREVRTKFRSFWKQIATKKA